MIVPPHHCFFFLFRTGLVHFTTGLKQLSSCKVGGEKGSGRQHIKTVMALAGWQFHKAVSLRGGRGGEGGGGVRTKFLKIENSHTACVSKNANFRRQRELAFVHDKQMISKSKNAWTI